MTTLPRPWARAALGAAALASASGLHATGLFQPVDHAGAAAEVAKAGSGAARASVRRFPNAWERRVRIARHQLTAARADVETGGKGRLLLDVRDGVRLDVAVERTAPTMFGYSLSGRVVGGAGGSPQVGFVTLVMHEEAVAASIWTPDSAYELSYLGDGVHALRDVTNAPPVECAGTVPSELSAAETAAEDGTDDGSVVDVLVVWTPAREEEAGGERQMLSRVDGLVAYANDAFERSGVLVSLNLVGAERVDYLEAGKFTDLDRLVTPDDGHMDRVHDLRDALGADLVNLQAVAAGGVAQLLGAFSVNAFAHEVGHNFGLLHERFELGGPGVDVHRGHGFTTERCSATIMSYSSECWQSRPRVPFYASPWRYSPRDGHALGVSRFSKERGVRGPADAARRVNQTRHRVANFRPSRNGA